MELVTIAEDEGIRTTARAVAERFDWRVRAEAADPEAGLRLLRDGRPDLVLLDLGLGGVALFERSRQEQTGLEVLLLSTETDQEDVLGCLKQGARGYLLIDDPNWTEDLANRLRTFGQETSVD